MWRWLTVPRRGWGLNAGMNILVVGATGGIGAAVARALAGRGTLTLSGRNAARGEALAAELGARFVAADLGFESHVARLFEGLPRLDALVYAAGAAHPQPLKTAQAAEVRAVCNANYFGALWALKHGLPRLQPGGRVYLLGARPELVTARGFSQYAASKAALARLAEVTRLEARGVGVTLVLPPAVDTPLWQQVGRAPRSPLGAEAVALSIAEHLDGPGGDELRPG